MATLALTLTLSGANVSAATPRLSSELMTLTQLPQGWSADSLSGSVSAGCLTNVFGLTNVLMARGVHQTSSAKVFFVDNDGVPAISEMLATYANPVAAYGKVVATLTSCKHVSAKAFGSNVTGSMEKKGFAHYASTSEAFAATVTILGTNFNAEIIVARKGDVVMAMVEASLPPFNVHQFQGLIVKALAKVR
jgi:hypothetical protein